jgi:hypothetical protein
MYEFFSSQKCVGNLENFVMLVPLLFCLVNRGFSIGIGDVTPGHDLILEKKKLVHDGLVYGISILSRRVSLHMFVKCLIDAGLSGNFWVWGIFTHEHLFLQTKLAKGISFHETA